MTKRKTKRGTETRRRLLNIVEILRIRLQQIAKRKETEITQMLARKYRGTHGRVVSSNTKDAQFEVHQYPDFQ